MCPFPNSLHSIILSCTTIPYRFVSLQQYCPALFISMLGGRVYSRTTYSRSMNHTITFQMQPSYHPKGQYGDSNIASHAIPQTWNKNGKCPNNTIPIRRIKEEDVLRASSINLYGKKRPESIPNIHPPVSNVTSGHQVCQNIIQKNHLHFITSSSSFWISF